MIPDTFFFVRLLVNKQDIELGPYLKLEHAVEILIDLCPSVVAMLGKGKNYSYEGKVEERILIDNGEIWKIVSVPLIENKSYVKNLIR